MKVNGVTAFVMFLATLGGIPLGFYFVLTDRDGIGTLIMIISIVITFAAPYMFMTEQERKDGVKAVQDADRRRDEIEKAEALSEDGAPWERKYLPYRCPYCNRYRVRYANWDDKKVSAAFWGIASSKLGKAYTCDACKKFWNNT